MANGIEEAFDLISTNSFDSKNEVIRQFLRSTTTKGLSSEQVILLTKAIAASSRTQLASQDPSATDIPSTGGPASLSTLIAPLLVTLCGGKVFKISATGRPAGAIDTLETLPGYRSELSITEVKRLLSSTNYIHIKQTNDFAPSDAKLIEMRREEGAMSSQDLAIASLLAKKFCVSLTNFVLDVRVGSSGNIGTSFSQAVTFSKRFVGIARSLGMRTRCVITDMRNWPQTPYWGRGESLLALGHILQGRAEEAVWAPLKTLAIETLTLSGIYMSNSKAEEKLGQSLSAKPIQRVSDLLERHGVHKGTFEVRINEIEAFTEFPVLAKTDCSVSGVDLGRLKKVVMNLYSLLPPSSEGVPHWEVGMRWRMRGGPLTKGQEICCVRVQKDYSSIVEVRIDEIASQVWDCMRYGEEEIRPPIVYCVIDEEGTERPPLA